MGLSFITPTQEATFIPIQIESSSISSSSETYSASTEQNATGSNENDKSSTYRTVTGASSTSRVKSAEQKYQANATSTGLTDYASGSGQYSYEGGTTTSSTFQDGTETASASDSASASQSGTSSSSRGFTDKTSVVGTAVQIFATTQEDESSTTFSTEFEAQIKYSQTTVVRKQATVRRVDTTTAETQSFASRLTTLSCLSSTTSTAASATGVATVSSTTTSTQFAAEWSSTSSSEITTTAPSTQNLAVYTTKTDESFAVGYGVAPASKTVHIAKNSPFDPIGVVRVIDAGGEDVITGDADFTYQKSKGNVDFVNGNKIYEPQTYEEDQNVTFITINASAATKTSEVTFTDNPAHELSVQGYERLTFESRTYCFGDTTSSYAHIVTTTAEHEEGDPQTFTAEVTDALTKLTTVTTDLVSTRSSIVNINVDSVNYPTILTTTVIDVFTSTTATVQQQTANGAVIVGNVETSTETVISNDSVTITQAGGYTFGNDSNRAKLVVQKQYFVGGRMYAQDGAMSFVTTKSVKGYAPFNASTDSRPIAFMGYTTQLESSEGFASWKFVPDGAIQRFNGVTHLDDNPCRTISETFTNSDVTFEQTITDSDDIQFFDESSTVINTENFRTEQTVFEASTGTATTTKSTDDGETVSTSTTTGFGHSVPNTTTTSALVTMSRTWTTGFHSEDTFANASARSLTYRGKYGNKGTVIVELCESVMLKTFERISASLVFRGPATVSVRAPYHFVGTLRDSSSTSSTEFFNGERNTERGTERLDLDREVEYSFEHKSMVAPANGGPAMLNAHTYDTVVFGVLSVDED